LEGFFVSSGGGFERFFYCLSAKKEILTFFLTDLSGGGLSRVFVGMVKFVDGYVDFVCFDNVGVYVGMLQSSMVSNGRWF